MGPIDETLLATVRAAVGGAPDAHTERTVLLTLQRLLKTAPCSPVGTSNLVETQRLLQAFLVPPQAVGASWLHADDEWLQLWIYKHLGGQSTVRLRQFDGMGRGLASTRSFACEEVIIRVPPALLLTADALHPCAAKLLAEATLGTEAEELQRDVALCLALIVAAAAGVGPWGEYARRLLPAKPPSALLWSAARLSAMRSTTLPAEVGAVRRALHTLHLRLFPALCRELPQLFPAAACRWKCFVWAYAIVESRAVVLNSTASTPQRSALVPVADMLNHSPYAQLAWPNIETDGSLVFRGLAAVPAGQQLYLYYGRHTPQQTLQHYGFVDVSYEAGRDHGKESEEEGEEVEGEEGSEEGSEEESLKEDNIIAVGGSGMAKLAGIGGERFVEGSEDVGVVGDGTAAFGNECDEDLNLHLDSAVVSYMELFKGRQTVKRRRRETSKQRKLAPPVR